MKIWKINSTDYQIYDYSSHINEDTIYEDVKKIFQRLKRILKLRGFYRVLVTFKKIGIFFQLIRIEDSFYKDTLDLKIEKNDCDIYYRTEDYFVVKDFSTLFFNGMYYVLVDDSFDHVLEKVEFGDFVFASSIEEVFKNGVVV